MKIKNGFGDKELDIHFESGSSIGALPRNAGMWIEFGTEPRKETLSYISLEELLILRNSINDMIKQMIGIV